MEQTEEAIRILSPIAHDYFEAPTTTPPTKESKISFFYANDSELASSLREEILKVPEVFPTLILVDIPNQKKYICDFTDNLNAEIITDFITRFRDKTLLGTELT